MDRIVVVGSGPRGVHFALGVLRNGHHVVMLDVGPQPAPVNPRDSLNGLKQKQQDPIRYFLGPQFEALILPDYGSEYYGFPPGKSRVFRERRECRFRAERSAPLASLAAGGLAEAWTGGPCDNEGS